MNTTQQAKVYPFLRGGGEMGERTRNYDWSQTPVGTPDQWPPALRSTVSTMLRSAFPMFLWWGEEMTQFYNDAYRPSLGNGGKHPAALGGSGPEFWPEIWPTIYPLIQQVRRSGEPTFMEDQLIPIYRNGHLEDVYWTFSYSLVLHDDGAPGGILVTCLETTTTVKGRIALEESERRYRNLIAQAPVAVGVTRGEDLIFENINAPMLRLIHRKDREAVLGRPVAEVLPEIVSQPVFSILQEVLKTGNTFSGTEVEVALENEGILERRYFNLTYSRVVDKDGIASVLHMASDVTAQVLARRKTEESEERFRLLADASPNLVWMLKGDGIYEYVNKTTLDFLGVTQEQIAAVGWGPFLHPDDVEPATKAIAMAVQTKQRYETEHRLRDKAGNYRWLLSQANPAYDANGEVFAYVGSSIDIHDAKNSRQALVESEARFRALADDSPVFVFMIDVDPLAPVSYWNKTWLTYTGQTYEQALGRAWDGILHPDDIPVVMEQYSPAFEKGAPYFIPAVRVRRSDGEYRWHAFKGSPRTLANGEFNGYVGMGFDIHDQRLAQEQLETALEQLRLSKEAAELGTFDMDLTKGTLHWDARCRSLFGIRHQRPVTYEKDFIEGLHPDDRERILAFIDKAFVKSESDGDYDVAYRSIGAEDGIERWVKAKGKVYFDENDRPVRFIGSVLDITDQMTTLQRIEHTVEERTRELARANESLQVTNRELERSNQNLEEFAHAASHDLKEPIRKIHFFTNQLKGQLAQHVGEKELGSFTRIENATRRMGNLIDDLLLYSHVSQRPHEKESVDLNEKVLRVLDDLELDIAEKRAQVSVGTLPVVAGYRRQLQQLFQNLVSNALKYSKAGVPPEIGISAQGAEREGRDYHLIKVSDNGIGIAAEHSDKIFQMFTRLHGKNEYSGTGVGLSIVKKVVENHHGFVGVSSEPGVGSVFEIYLPV